MHYWMLYHDHFSKYPHSSLIISVTFSAIIKTGMFICADIISDMIDASATLNP